MTTSYEYLIGVDGGGTKTHVRIETPDGIAIAAATAGPSALMHGRRGAWIAVCDAVRASFHKAGITPPEYEHMAVGCGLSGVNVPQWADEFSSLNPGFGSVAVASDAITTLLGAHQGKPGAIIAIGTGSIGAALLTNGRQRVLGGWGFPSGDEASGAWLGLRAVNHVQQVLDGQVDPDVFAQDILRFCVGDDIGNGDRNSMLDWLARANQSKYAQLAPLVINHAIHSVVARNIMEKAGSAIEKLASALDPSTQLPLALCGGLAVPLQPFLPQALRQRAISPVADSAAGGLIVIRQHLAMECI